MDQAGKGDMGREGELVGTKGRAQRAGLGEGKPQLSLVLEFAYAMAGAARALAAGVEKYGRGNWKKGMPQEEVVDSLMRHLTAMVDGEDIDPTDGIPHSDKVLSNSLMLAEYAAWARLHIKSRG